MIDEFDRHFQLLLSQSLMGELVAERRAKTRRTIVKKRFLVFYKPIDEGVLILRVLHGSRLIRPEDLGSLEE